jgi:hypothetical protein
MILTLKSRQLYRSGEVKMSLGGPMRHDFIMISLLSGVVDSIHVGISFDL